MKRITLLSLFLCYCLAALCQGKPPAAKSQPLILGQTDEIMSSVLSEGRKLNIYLPPGYNAADTARYPVVYLLDGGMDEDFIHITGLYQFNSFPWINRVAPSIIVGIVNTDRLRDMSFPTTDTAARRKYPAAGGSQKFMRFIETELQPYIEKKFKTTASRTLIGESMGGLFATEVLLKKPGLFNHYIIVSPSLWWDNGSLLDGSPALLKANAPQSLSVYIGVGKEGLMPGRVPRVMEVDANVLADNIQAAKGKGVSVYFDYLPAENHATIMHGAVMNALRVRF